MRGKTSRLDRSDSGRLPASTQNRWLERVFTSINNNLLAVLVFLVLLSAFKAPRNASASTFRSVPRGHIARKVGDRLANSLAFSATLRSLAA